VRWGFCLPFRFVYRSTQVFRMRFVKGNLMGMVSHKMVGRSSDFALVGKILVEIFRKQAHLFACRRIIQKGVGLCGLVW
jgi:hypothetical protein